MGGGGSGGDRRPPVAEETNFLINMDEHANMICTGTQTQLKGFVTFIFSSYPVPLVGR